MTNTIEELNSSELGTHQFWEDTYSKEIENFEDSGDIGEVWFGTRTSTELVKFVSSQLNICKESDRIIDLGCGNALTLVHFGKAGYKNLVGVDYSEKAIDLAKKVVNENGFPDVELRVYDILRPNNDSEERDFLFKLAHDKGTYDAVSLNPESPRSQRERYMRNVSDLLCEGGFLAITSCNWTKDELIEHFKEHFELVHELPSKCFSFGDKTGNKFTKLIFVKK